jgi:hypothetical protein
MGASVEKLSYMDMEGELWAALNMSELTCQTMERIGTRTGTGVTISAEERRILCFAIAHTNSLLATLQEKFNAIHESNGGRA